MTHTVAKDITVTINGIPVIGWEEGSICNNEYKSKLSFFDMGSLDKSHPDYDPDVVKVSSDYATFYLREDSESYTQIMDEEEHSLVFYCEGECLSDKEMYMKLWEGV